MRVTPWNHYQLVDQESDPDVQLASKKKRLFHGCASFLCFGHSGAGLECLSSLKVGPTQHQQEVLKCSDLEQVKEKVCSSDIVDDDSINNLNASSLRSSLKRPATTGSVSIAVKNECESVNRKETNGVNQIERRVQWTDVSGGELFVIREFEPSEHGGLDDEFENREKRSCVCRFM